MRFEIASPMAGRVSRACVSGPRSTAGSTIPDINMTVFVVFRPFILTFHPVINIFH